MAKASLHISLTPCLTESRLLKECRSTLQARLSKKVYVAALYEEGLKEYDEYDHGQILLWRVPLRTRRLPKNLLLQCIKYLEWILKIFIRYRKKSIDIVYCHSFGSLPLAPLFKIFSSCKIIYDAHELESERNGLHGLRKLLVKLLEGSSIRFCDDVLVVSESIADDYVRRYRTKRPLVLLNCPNYSQIEKHQHFRRRFQIPESSIIFLYQGGLAPGRGVEHILKAFQKLLAPENVVVFMGKGVLQAKIENSAQEYPNIFYHEAVSPDRLLEYTASADWGLSLIENLCLSYYYCLPNKMFEYMMAGLPVVVSNLPEMKRVVLETGIGCVMPSNSPKGVKEAVEAAIQMDRKALEQAIKQAAKTYNWEKQETKLLEAHQRLAA